MKRLAAVFLLLAGSLFGADYPWMGKAPAEIAQASLQPDTVLDEIPCDWRPALTPIVEPLVKDCTTAREAVLSIASGLSKATGVYYTPQRRKHNMNALEALEEKKVSCTGQSILLVCALRSVGIPARAVGLLTWNHIEGNHTWAEAWFDGAWHMIEFNEHDFNTSWVMEYVGMLNEGNPLQRIKAATPAGNTTWYPAMPKLPVIQAEDVTERYRQLSLNWYQASGLAKNSQRLMIDLQPRRTSETIVELVNDKGLVITETRLPSLSDDMRCMARLTLPRQGNFYLRIKGTEHLIPISATESAVQLLKLVH